MTLSKIIMINTVGTLKTIIFAFERKRNRLKCWIKRSLILSADCDSATLRSIFKEARNYPPDLCVTFDSARKIHLWSKWIYNWRFKDFVRESFVDSTMLFEEQHTTRENFNVSQEIFVGNVKSDNVRGRSNRVVQQVRGTLHS